MKNQTKIRVLVAEDHAVVREGLRLLLGAAEDMDVVGEAADGRQAVQMALRLQPDVILLDIAMPLLNGMEATRQILRDCPKARVLILSSHSEDEYVRTSLNHGVAGYVAKQSAMKEVLEAIREVYANRSYFSPCVASSLTNLVRAQVQGGQAEPRGLDLLTSRQTETLQLIAEGLPNKQIAEVLGLSIKTVEKHRQDLMVKLNLHNTAGLTRFAIEHGLVENPSASLSV